MKRAGLFFVAACTGLVGTSALADEAPQFNNNPIAPALSSLSANVPVPNGSINTTAMASYATHDQSVMRLESSWNSQLNDSGRSLRVGDAISNPGAWGSAVRFAGVQFGTSFSMRSDLIDSDRVALTGIAVLPSTVDAMLGSIAPEASLTQRGLSVNGKTSVASVNTLAFATRDAGGRVLNVNRPLLAKDSTVDPGCKQFSLGVGRARRDYALVSDNYGPLFANSTLVCGTDAGYTIEAHGEYLEGDARLAGVDVIRSINSFGTASLAMAASQKDDVTGWLVRAGLQRSDDLFEINLRARLQSPDFREIGANDIDPITSRMLASVGAKLSEHSTLALAYANQTTVSQQRTNVVAMTHTIELGSKGSKGKISIVADHAMHDDNTGSSFKISYIRKLRD